MSIFLGKSNTIADNTNLEESMDKYNRMMHLNEHIRRQFQKKIKEIRKSNTNKKKKTSIKD